MTTSGIFDPGAYKVRTRQQWDRVAERWNRWSDTLDAWFGPPTETLLDQLDVTTGRRVLDIAAGTGEQTIQIARRVGPTGSVLATDLSPEMLRFAADKFRTRGFTQIETKVADAEDLGVPPASFDVAISRAGLIFVPDKPKALAQVVDALKPDGRLGIIAYTGADRNDFFRVPISIIRRRANLPPPGPDQPGPFSLAAPGMLERLLTEAGFRKLEISPVAAPLKLASASECVRFERESFGALHEMMSGLTPDQQESTWAEIADAFAAYETAAGFECPCELLVAAARR
jgi:SAM-dependent methyltransferase